jgi:hypothetical protein
MATGARTRTPPKGEAVITGITEVTYIHTKQDMSRWTRAHEKAERITWSVFPGPGGTMIIVEHEEDRATLLRRESLSADIEVAPGVAASMAEAPASQNGNMNPSTSPVNPSPSPATSFLAKSA